MQGIPLIRPDVNNENIISLYNYFQLLSNHPFVFLQNTTKPSISGTSIKTPTTVAKAAPEDRPNNITDVAMTSMTN